MFLLAVTQPGEILERMRDEIFAAWILSLRCGSKESNKILRHGCRLRPGFGRSRREEFIKLFVATLQGLLIGLEPNEPLTANLCGLLSSHAAALVEVDRNRWIVRHGHTFFFRLRLDRGFVRPRTRLPELRSVPDNTI